MIPSLAHFIWFGRDLPWVHVLALRSAARRGGFERLVLHHADDLSGTRWWPDVQAIAGLETRPLDAEAVLGAVPDLGGRLVDLYRRLTQPAGRANMVRAALLAAEGGVYLDLDTVTVRSLGPLRATAGVFCGAERLVFPAAVRRSRRPRVLAAAGLRTVVRDVLRRTPEGWRAFHLVQRAYPTAVNNAVLGAAPGHPLVRELLTRMVEMPRERQTVRFALGTHLLQDVVAAYPGRDLTVHAPAVFYPLAPEISEHWFRDTRHPRLDHVVAPETRVVHWYASVRTAKLVPAIDPAWVRAHADRQLFSALALPFVA